MILEVGFGLRENLVQILTSQDGLDKVSWLSGLGIFIGLKQDFLEPVIW